MNNKILEENIWFCKSVSASLHLNTVKFTDFTLFIDVKMHIKRYMQNNT